MWLRSMPTCAASSTRRHPLVGSSGDEPVEERSTRLIQGESPVLKLVRRKARTVCAPATSRCFTGRLRRPPAECPVEHRWIPLSSFVGRSLAEESLTGGGMGLEGSHLTSAAAWSVDGVGKAQPNAELVTALTRELHRSEGGQGYVALRANLSDISVTQGRDRQIALVLAIWDEMLVRRLTSHDRGHVRLNAFEANDGSLPSEIVGDVSTFKRLHFDPYSIFFAHLYEEPRNLLGGRVSLVDVRGYLKGKDLELLDVFDPLRLPGHNGRLVAREEHRSRLLEDHASHIDPPGPGELLLLMVRNDPTVGVAHEIEEVRPIDPAAPVVRRFFRASIAPHH